MLRFIKEGSNLIINASGGDRVLKSLGYRTENEIQAEKKAVVRKERLNAFVTEFKEKGLVGYREAKSKEKQLEMSL